MDQGIKEFIEEDKEFLSQLWQKNQNILGHAKKLKDSIESHILIVTNPIGKEMLKTMDVLIEQQESKIKIIEERMDKYEEMLNEG